MRWKTMAHLDKEVEDRESGMMKRKSREVQLGPNHVHCASNGPHFPGSIAIDVIAF